MTPKTDASIKGVLRGEMESLLSQPAPSRSSVTEATIMRSDAAIAGMMHRARLPRRHRETPCIDRNGAWASAARDLCASMGSGCLIALLGPRGTGKTQLAVEACWTTCQRAVNEFANRTTSEQTVKDAPALYCKALEMFLTIRAGYKQDGPTEKELIKLFVKPDLLVIDEIQERGETEWEDRVLVHIIDRRYDDMRDTMLIGNLTEQRLADSAGPSVMSRMRECGRIVVCDWKGFRGGAT